MRDGFRILDADRHVIEPDWLWDKYLGAEFRSQAPRRVPFFEATGTATGDPSIAQIAHTRPMLVVAGKPVCQGISPLTWAQIVLAAAGRTFAGPLDRPETHLAHMDSEGIDAAVLYPTYGLLIEGVDTLGAELAAALASAYNRWLVDFCARAPDRLVGMGLVSVHAPEHMVSEVARAAEYGFRGVVIRPNPAQCRRLSDPAYASFWANCEGRSLAVVIHEATHAYLPTAGADRFGTRFAQHACSHPMEQMIALLDLIEGGVFERHPRLRVAFLEAGCGWVPYWMWRLDSEYAHLSREVEGHVRAAPSSYFRRQAWVTAESDEPYLPELLEFVGADRILFGTDFPHVDHEDGLVTRALDRVAQFREERLRAYLWENGARFFGINSVNTCR
jgi:predicted TIM-barrel fold metal-dependent hydrolase